MCFLLLSKADLRQKAKFFSAAHLHFGSESIVMLLLPSLVTFPQPLCIRVLGELLGLAPQNKEAVAQHSPSNVSQQFLTISPSYLSPPSSLLLSL